jgi:glycosyltransferase involved in cell wall biosynthesis
LCAQAKTAACVGAITAEVLFCSRVEYGDESLRPDTAVRVIVGGKGLIDVLMMTNGNWRKSGRRRPRVLIVFRYVPQYRQAFYEGLRVRLAQEGVDFDLVYGDPSGDDAKKSDAVALDWAIHLPSKYFSIGKTKLIYQPIAKLSSSYDLVIVEQANKLLVNLILLGMNRLGMTRVAYWGHGKNSLGGDSFLTRAMKRALVSRVHWWFAYNELSAAVVRETGFPDERITRCMNTIDNEELKSHLEAVTPEEVDQQRQKLGLRGRNVCIFIGAMYGLRRLPFLLAACERIRHEVPDFEIVFLGSGVDRPLVDQFAAEHDWAIVCGPAFGREKALNLKLAKLFLMPGVVGLAIIDAFTSQVPMVTTSVPGHGPEIEYLINGVNGEMVPSTDSASDYADRVVALLLDEDRLSILRNGCKDASKTYTMSSMVARFSDGVLGALKP